MGKDPGAIREEIARTREGMAGTVDALAYKTDVKERTKDKVKGLTAKPKDAILSIRDNVMGTVQEHTPDRSTIHDAQNAVSQAPGQVVDQTKRVAQRAGGVIKENPVGLALGGLALGFVAGLVLPSTKLEDEKLGQFGDQIRSTAKEQGQEFIEHGKEVAQAAAGAATEAVKDASSEHADEFAESTKDKASNLQSVGSGSTSF
ncbi:MAG: protein of unknown function ElaB [Thermoleophilia bacterium]|nr:protein of unknown function ElaB [Thermoleophilia bacterium]